MEYYLGMFFLHPKIQSYAPLIFQPATFHAANAAVTIKSIAFMYMSRGLCIVFVKT